MVPLEKLLPKFAFLIPWALLRFGDGYMLAYYEGHLDILGSGGRNTSTRTPFLFILNAFSQLSDDGNEFGLHDDTHIYSEKCVPLQDDFVFYFQTAHSLYFCVVYMHKHCFPLAPVTRCVVAVSLTTPTGLHSPDEFEARPLH